jgi:hypothetical protein
MTFWAPVVYGRTPASDNWWRAVPEGLNQHGWLGTVVESALGAGRELKERPRFLLAQNQTNRIIGVACQASDLSDTMRSVGSRPLYCFVGWVASRIGEPWPVTPEFEELARDYRDWAAPVYARVLAEPWRALATAHLQPVTTQPERPVWPPPARQPEPGESPPTGPWAEQAWPSLWAAAAGASESLICVIGWQHKSSARYEDATHIGVADAPSRPLPEVRYPGQPLERVPVDPGPVDPGPMEPEQESTPVPVLPRPAEPVPVGAAPYTGVIPAEQWLADTGPPVIESSGGASHGGASHGGTSDGGTSDGGHTRHGRVPDWAKLVAAAAAGATVVGVLVGVLSSGPAPVVITPAAPTPAPTPTAIPTPTPTPIPTLAPGTTGLPVVLRVVVSASARSEAGSLIQYTGGALSPGQSTVRMALWSGGPADPGACASAVAAAPVAAPVKAHRHLQLCVELNDRPPSYGLIDVTSFSRTTVIATATLWP